MPSPRFLSAAILAAFVTLLAGCGPNIAGTYTGVPGQSVFERIELQPGGKVVVTLIGIAHEATYEVKGATVVVNNGGQLSELKIDEQGCLVDAIGGRYCKGADSATPAVAASPARSGSGGLSGSYEVKGLEGRAMTITFTGATTFNLVLSGEAMNSTIPGTYELHGDQALLKVMGDTEGQAFTRKGNTLVGSLDGEAVTFVRK